MVGMLAMSALDRGFDPLSGNIKPSIVNMVYGDSSLKQTQH